MKNKIIFKGVERNCQPISFTKLLVEYAHLSLKQARDIRLRIADLEEVEIEVESYVANIIINKSESFGFHCRIG